jgi:hypothetical protein
MINSIFITEFLLISARDCSRFLRLLLISRGLYKTKDAFANTFWLNADWVEMTYCSELSLSTTYCWLMRERMSKWGRGRIASPGCQSFLFLKLGQLNVMPTMNILRGDRDVRYNKYPAPKMKISGLKTAIFIQGALPLWFRLASWRLTRRKLSPGLSQNQRFNISYFRFATLFCSCTRFYIHCVWLHPVVTCTP